MSADPDAQLLRSFGHRCLLMADRIERQELALQKIWAKAAASTLCGQSLLFAQEIAEIAREGLQEVL